MWKALALTLLIFAALLWLGPFWTESPPEAAQPEVRTAKPAAQKEKTAMATDPATTSSAALPKTNAEWKKVLTPEQYRVTRQKGTEAPFSGEYYQTDREGVYRCACCGAPLFTSETKFDAHCGWPSFWGPLDEANIKKLDDFSLRTHRIEVQCKNCGAHLGHLFDDGPQPTGQRYCINSVSLKLHEKKKPDAEKAKPAEQAPANKAP